MTRHETLAALWQRLWNGELDLADQVVAENFVTHAALMGGVEEQKLEGRAALHGWIAGLRTLIHDLHFVIEIGPIQDRDYLVVRWRASGTYAGGMPGIGTQAIGREVDFTGTDILRVGDGKLAEYWVNSDVHLLLAQLS